MLFIKDITSNGFNLDFVVLKDGRVLGIDDATVVLYKSMEDFEDMLNIDRQSIDLSQTPTLVDQIATLVERVAKLEAHATTRARDFRDAVRNEIDEYDFDYKISDAMENHDFIDAIHHALDNHDLTTVIEETLRGKTITIC